MLKSSIDIKKASLIKLGEILKKVVSDEDWPGFSIGITEEEYNKFKNLLPVVKNHNGWFSIDMVKNSLFAWSELLTTNKLEQWLSSYEIQTKESNKNIAIICAGNIPIVAFHDVISGYLSGHSLKVKLASSDNVLLPALIELLSKFDIQILDQIDFIKNKLTGFHAVIATGSNNTSRYFEEYFGKHPSIIRKSRTSIAFLTGDETDTELEELAKDVFMYYGLGCRNVTKLFLPKGFDLDRIFKGFYSMKEIINNNKYANNYNYHKTIFLMDKYEIIENGFLILKEDSSMFSPVGTLYYEFYDDINKVKTYLSENSDLIQCVVGYEGLPFGKAQEPELWDYADNVDTLNFLTNLK